MPRLNEVNTSQTWDDVTPSDTDDFVAVPRAIYVGTGGDVAAVGLDGAVVTFKNAQSGSVLPIAPKRINDTDTTATDLVALF